MAVSVVRSARTVRPTWARRSIFPSVLAAVGGVAVLSLAAGLRLWRLDLVEFSVDESWALRLAEDWVRLGRVPLAGLRSSVGLNNPPDLIYLLAPVVAVTRDPAVASGFVGLANVAGVAGLVLLGWRIFSPLAGLVAGVVFATNPWAVFYGRKIWDNDLMAPLAILLFVALERAVLAKRLSWAIASLPIFAVGVEMHSSFGTLAPVMIAPIAVLVARGHWRQLTVGICLVMLTAVPYVIFNFQRDWADLHGVQQLMTLPATLDGEGAARVLGLATGWDNWEIMRVHLDRVLPGRLAALAANVQTVLVCAGLGLAMVLAFAPGAAGRAVRLHYGALVLWLLLPAVLSVRHSVPLYEHYFTFVPPAAALLIAGMVHWLAQRPSPWGRPLLGLALVSVLVLGSIETAMVVRLLNHLAVQDEPGYGPPLAMTQAIAGGVASFGAATGSQHLSIEFPGTDSQPIAYLTRPFFPSIEIPMVGEVGLGPGSTSSPPAPEPRFLGLPERLDLSYTDGVRVLYAATSTHLVASERVGLAITWVVNPPTPAAATPGVIWELALYDRQGQELARRAGLQHDITSTAPSEAVTSWLTLETEPSTAPGQYELWLRRLDAATGQPLPFLDALARTATEWRSHPIETALRAPL